MKKNVFLSIFVFFTIHAVCQDKDSMIFKINFQFNNYDVCDLVGNFQFYIFYVDSNNYYRLDTVGIQKNKINVDLDIEKNEIIAVIFQYKIYILTFGRDNIDDIFKKNNYNYLDFCIAKKNNYKKYISKSYSKQYKKSSEKKLNDWEFDVSCNGLQCPDGTGCIDVFNVEYRRHLNEHFNDIGFRNNDKGYISVSYSMPPWTHTVYSPYTDFEKFFKSGEELFEKILFVVGKDKSYIEPSLIHTLQIGGNVP